jgi:hypothetical protein
MYSQRGDTTLFTKQYRSGGVGRSCHTFLCLGRSDPYITSYLAFLEVPIVEYLHTAPTSPPINVQPPKVLTGSPVRWHTHVIPVTKEVEVALDKSNEGLAIYLTK